MTADDFRKLALSFPEAAESRHMHHPDFRVRGKIFATLGYPNERWGMVKLTPAQQTRFVISHPDVFVPANGAWGRAGATTVNLSAARKSVLLPALDAAWGNVALKGLATQMKTGTGRGRSASRSSMTRHRTRG
jgi:YjbR protein